MNMFISYTYNFEANSNLEVIVLKLQNKCLNADMTQCWPTINANFPATILFLTIPFYFQCLSFNFFFVLNAKCYLNK